MPAFVERDALAKRQDLSDMLALADMKKTIFTSMVPKGVEPMNTLTEWPVDNYPAVSTTGAVDEAPVSTYDDIHNVAAKLQGRVMIKQRTFRVSRFADRVMDQAGVGKRKAYAKAAAKALVILKRDIEAICLSDDESYSGSATKGNQTRGLGKWLSTTAQTDLPVDTNFLLPAASVDTTTIANWLDTTVMTVLQSVYDQTGDDEMDLMLICGSTLRRKISRLTWYDKDDSGFIQTRRFNQDAESAKVTMKVSILDTDFGRAVVRSSSFINASDDPTSAASKRLGYLFPMVDQAVRLRFGWEPNVRQLPDDGGGPRAIAEAAFVLEVGNPLWFAKFAPSA